MQTKRIYSLPDDIAHRFESFVPLRSRSKVIAELMKKEIQKRELALYNCAKEVEADEELTKEMAEWEQSTIEDGLKDESW